MRHLFDFIDPMRKGPLFHRYGWKGILFIMVDGLMLCVV